MFIVIVIVVVIVKNFILKIITTTITIASVIVIHLFMVAPTAGGPEKNVRGAHVEGAGGGSISKAKLMDSVISYQQGKTEVTRIKTGQYL